MRTPTAVLFLASVLAGTVLLPASSSLASGSFNTYTMQWVGADVRSTSLALDVSGNPIIAFSKTGAFNDLLVMHCNDPDCAGSDEVITSPDTSGDVGAYISMVLDSSGNPVISYQDVTNEDLKVMHCNDPSCSGGDESITAPQTTGRFGYRTSIALDSAGRPVIVHQAFSNDLRIVRCNDVNCAGSDESVTSPDPSTAIYATSSQSLALDASDRPVVAYYDYGISRLRVLHCNDPFCGGGGESITMPESVAYSGYAPSVVLDAAGNPVVAYTALPDDHIKVMHCKDAECAGGDESIVAEGAGSLPYLRLDGSGYPVVIYVAPNPNIGSAPRVLHCNDADCAGVDDPVAAPITYDNHFSQRFQLDSLERPVVATVNYVRLGVLHCADTYCTPDLDGDDCADAQEQLSLDDDWEVHGGNRNPKNPYDYFDASHDGQVRINDIVLVVNAYYKDQWLNPPTNTIPNPAYNSAYDRTYVGPNNWNLGPPNGLQRVDDILNEVHQYFHDCS